MPEAPSWMCPLPPRTADYTGPTAKPHEAPFNSLMGVCTRGCDDIFGTHPNGVIMFKGAGADPY